jgi:hypothetical protein
MLIPNGLTLQIKNLELINRALGDQVLELNETTYINFLTTMQLRKAIVLHNNKKIVILTPIPQSVLDLLEEPEIPYEDDPDPAISLFYRDEFLKYKAEIESDYALKSWVEERIVEVNTGGTVDISSKADKTYVDTQLSKKTDKTYVDAELSKKTDKGYVDGEVAKKIDKAYVDNALSAKTDKTYVDGKLAEKSDTTVVEAKADKTYVDKELELKASKTYVENRIIEVNSGGTIDVSHLAQKTYVDTELEKKADISYVDNQVASKSIYYEGATPPEDTNLIWVDTSDEDIDEVMKTDLGNEIKNTVAAIKTKVDALEYALDYELDPGYFKGIRPGSDGTSTNTDPNAPDLGDGAEGTVGHILVKRGYKADIENLQEGEFGFCIDTEELYIGNKGRLRLIAKVGGTGGSGGSGNVTADYVELISESGKKYRLSVNDAGEPMILSTDAATINLPDPADPLSAGRFQGLFINKVYGGGARNTNDTVVSHSFIELYNSTEATMNLRGLSLQYGEYLQPWKVLELEGEIKPYSSFLVRCAQHSDPYRRSVRCKVFDFDMGWDIPISDNGFKVYLCVGTTASTYVNPANTDGQKTKAPGYINLFGVGGEDITRPIDGFEKGFLQLVNKNRMIKRKYSEDVIFAFSNTGDNSYDIDYVDMRTADLNMYSPRSSKFGQWDYAYDQIPLDTSSPNVISLSFGYDGDTTRTFTWQSQPTDKGYLKYKRKGDPDWITVPSTKKFIAHPDHVDVTVHGVIVKNLVPGTTYVYKAGYEGHWSDEYEHTVIDARSTSRPIKMVWTTDQQSWNGMEYTAWAKANAYIEKNETYDFILNSGDRTQNANRSFEWRGYFESAKQNLATHVEMSTVGNNDLVDKLYSYAYSYYSTIENSPYPSVYSWNYGYTHFICLDSNILTEPLDPTKFIRGTAEQIEFVKADMAKPENQKRWVVAFMHESSYTIVRAKKCEPFIAALYDAGVDVVLCGHHHCYTRSYRMGKLNGTKDVIDDANGVYWLMMQATGYKLSGKTAPATVAPWRAVYEKPGDPCYGTLTFSWDKIEYHAYRLTNIMPLIDNVGKEVVPIEFDSLTILPKANRR